MSTGRPSLARLSGVKRVSPGCVCSRETGEGFQPGWSFRVLFLAGLTVTLVTI